LQRKANGGIGTALTVISRDTPIRINFRTVYLQAFRRLLNNLATLYKLSIPMGTNRHDISQLRLIYIKVQLNELRANIDAYKENIKTMVSFIEAFNNHIEEKPTSSQRL
jgi:hypothetical protein